MKKTKNPLLDSKIFVPDAEAHVWEDGRIYLYGSFDIVGKKDYCSDVYHVYSSDDMINWVDHGVAFSLAHTTWAKDCGALYAPDCAYKNGKYYLYYCVPDGRCGVAVSSSPAGPFSDIGPIEGVWGIDPAVFIDDDGQAYLYWGQLTWCHAAKLKDNMTEIIKDTVTTPLTIEKHEFHEGSSVKKINGKYYYLFADTHRHGGRPTCLGYAVSDEPLGEFEYKGVIIDNFGCDPFVWNNHGSIELFQGQWYVFYHRSTHGFEFSRHVCAEPIFINEDGSIPEVKQTSFLGHALSASNHIPANTACFLSGNVRIAVDEESENHLCLREIKDSDSMVFRSLDFKGENIFAIRMKNDLPCKVSIYADEVLVNELAVLPSESFVETKTEFRSINGIYELKLVFSGDFNSADVDEFYFFKQ
ncbi:MAG: xylosidase [Ruminococcaceae bacterium]|nr:xylosidase [Oscillospiraceae bacterium]